MAAGKTAPSDTRTQGSVFSWIRSIRFPSYPCFCFNTWYAFSSKSSKKQKEEAAQIVKAGLYEDKNGTKYQESDGSFCKNDWREVGGSKYYFNKDGYMTTGWLEELDGKEYFFDENGKYDSTKHRPMVALTFDDGPGRFTDKLLDCLEENNAKATFFMLGENVERISQM